MKKRCQVTKLPIMKSRQETRPYLENILKKAEKHTIMKNLEDSRNKQKKNPFSTHQPIEESISTTLENCAFELGVDGTVKRRNIDELKDKDLAQAALNSLNSLKFFWSLCF